MLPSLTVLLLFQLAGVALVQLLRLPVPGPVLGMGLLFTALFASCCYLWADGFRLKLARTWWGFPRGRGGISLTSITRIT